MTVQGGKGVAAEFLIGDANGPPKELLYWGGQRMLVGPTLRLIVALQPHVIMMGALWPAGTNDHVKHEKIDRETLISTHRHQGKKKQEWRSNSKSKQWLSDKR